MTINDANSIYDGGSSVTPTSKLGLHVIYIKDFFKRWTATSELIARIVRACTRRKIIVSDS